MSGHILVVEDDGDTARLIGDLLTEELDGVEVITARDAEEALAAVRQATPDLALIDLMLPTDCGIELAAIVTQMAPGTTPLLAMSGSVFLAEVARESQLFQAVLEKPFDLDELLLQVAECRVLSVPEDTVMIEESRVPPSAVPLGAVELVARA